MLSIAERRWVLVALLATMAILVVASFTSGQTHTWDDEADFHDGDWDATLWDSEEEGITLTGKSSFWKYRGNALINKGSSGAWDDDSVYEPTVVFAKGQYYLYYTGSDGSDLAIGLARSDDGKTFSKFGTSARISKGSSGAYDGDGCREPSVIYEDGLFKMWYTGINGGAESIAYATSKDGTTWSKYGSNPVLSQPSTGWGSNEFGDPCVIRVDGMYHMYLTGSASLNNKLVGIATSKDGTTWNLHGSNPIVAKAGTGAFGHQEICDVAVLKDGPLFRMYFSGRNDASGKFKIGYGESFDGFNWVLNKGIYINLGATDAFDDVELNSPGVILGDAGAIHMYYQGSDSGNDSIGLTTSMPWLLRPNTSFDKILSTGSTYDSIHLQDPCVFLHPGGVYNMYYGCYGGGTYPYAIARATSTSSSTGWGRTGSAPVLIRGLSGTWDDDKVSSPCVIFDQGLYKMWYAGNDSSVWKIGYATSVDGNKTSKYGSNPVLSGTSGEWDADGVTDPWVLRVGQTYHMWYIGWASNSGQYVGHATSEDGVSWTKDSANPVFGPEPGNPWEQCHISNPCVTRENGRYVMYYSGTYTISNKERIGLAYSHDGGNWTRDDLNPYMDWGNSTTFNDEGVSMGSVLRVGGFNHIYYAGYNGSSWTVGYATYATKKATYTTPVLDASSAWPVAWGSLSWDADVPLGTYIGFQVATNQGGTVWRFVGPDGTDGTYFTEPGRGTFWFQSGKYMRVRANIETDDMEEFMPLLRSITVTYASRTGESPPRVSVTSPDGGEDWMKTKAYPITWEATGNLNDTSITLAYSTDNGTSWTDIATRRPNKGFYKWTVPSIETSGAMIRVTVTDIDGLVAEDTSDATFAIDPPAPKVGAFHFPAEGDVLAPGHATLSWTVEDPWGLADAPLTLELTTDGGITWSSLAKGIPFTDGIQWEVPDLTRSSGQCRLRLSVLSWLGDVSVIESGEFSIDVAGPTVTLGDLPDSVTSGKEFTLSAVAEDDLVSLTVDLHVRSTEGVRSYPMSGEDGLTWSVLYVPEDGDTEVWVTASDGVHETTSVTRELDVERASASGGSGTTGLAAELLVAAVIAVMVTLAMVAVALRRRG